MREFKKVKRLNGVEIKLPKRSTELSAGYDFFAPEDVIVLPMKANPQPILVRTGIKAYMPKDEFLMICNRSSNPATKRLVVPNGIGVVDSDYVDNPDKDIIVLQMVICGDMEVIAECVYCEDYEQKIETE